MGMSHGQNGERPEGPAPEITEDLRLRLAQSMVVVERCRPAILAQLKVQFRTLARTDDADNSDATIRILFDLLLDGASDLAAFAVLRDLSRTSLMHRHRGISGRQYSRFGLALGPSLEGALGIAMPPETVTAWCDAYWIVIRHLPPPDDQGHGGPTLHRISDLRLFG